MRSQRLFRLSRTAPHGQVPDSHHDSEHGEMQRSDIPTRPASLIALQRTLGNQHARRLIDGIQRKITLPIQRVVDITKIAVSTGKTAAQITAAGVLPEDTIAAAIDKLRASTLGLSDGTLQALRIELERGGHSLERHGPHLGIEALEARLTTGLIGGEFAPAGSEGFATSFTNAEAYVSSQQRAQQKLNAAYAKTRDELAVFIAAYDAAAKPWFDNPDKASNGPALGKAMQARGTLYNKVQLYTSNGPRINDTLEYLPIAAAALGPKDLPAQGRDMVRFRDRYRFVLVHDDAVGKGMRVKPDQKEHPSSSIVNPKFPLAGVPAPLWNKEQLQSMGEIKGTATTFNPPGDNYQANATPATWPMPQHFPDNGAQGWRF